MVDKNILFHSIPIEFHLRSIEEASSYIFRNLHLQCVYFFLVCFPRSLPEEEAKHLFVMAICEHLMYLNNCCNFILYVLTARKFRKDLMNTLAFR